MSSEIGMPVMAQEKPQPRISFQDEAIDKYLPDDIESLNIGDIVELVVKAKVVSLEKRKATDYDGKKEKEVTRRCVDLELVGGPDKGWDKMKRKLGTNAADAMRAAEKK